MKHIYLYILPIVLLFIGCKSTKEDDYVSPMDFDINITRVQAQRAWIEVFPKNEKVVYSATVMACDEFKSRFKSDNEYIDYQDSVVQSIGKRSDKEREEYFLLLRTGTALEEAILAPETEYYVLIFVYHDGKPVYLLRKEPFATIKRRTSDIHLTEVKMDGTVISVVPSNNYDSYYWDYELLKTIRREYYGLHSWFFYNLLINYYQFDFMPEILSYGPDWEDAADFYTDKDLMPGDTITLLSVGYDARTGETTDAYEAFWIIYGGKNSASRVMEAEKDYFESVFIGTSKGNTESSMSMVPLRRSAQRLALSRARKGIGRYPHNRPAAR